MTAIMSGMSAKILIVGGTPQNRLVLCGLLQDDFDMHAVQDVSTALQRTASLNPEIVLLSPGNCDAGQVHRQLQADPRTAHIPVIYMLDSAEGDEAWQCMSRGAADYISWPYHPALVKARLQQQLELKRSREALQTLIRTDELTQVANRRAFEDALADEWKRCGRASTYLSMLLIEVDRFDTYATRNGKAAANARLQEIAACIAMCVDRTPDVVARYDNARFACLLPETSPIGAVHVAEYVRDAVADLGKKAQGRLTLSQGIATFIPSGDTPSKELLGQAERALGVALDQGGGRICDQDDLRYAA